MFPPQAFSIPCRLHSSATTSVNLISLHSTLLDAITTPSHLHQAHAHIITTGVDPHPVLATKLLLSCDRLSLPFHAHHLFDRIPHPNVFHYNAILGLHSRHGRSRQVLQFYNKMQSFGVPPAGSTFPCVLRACGGCAEVGVEMGKAVHGQVLRFGFEGNLFVLNGVVAMYAKCKAVRWARLVFDRLVVRNVVTWTAMMSGYVQNGFPVEAVEVFREMRAGGNSVLPDFVALVSVLKGYMDVGGLEQGKSVHGYVIKAGLELEVDLRVTLTAMYAKCGQVLPAKFLFEGLPCPPVMLWNAMISGYAKNGYASEAVELFRKMVADGVRPDSITLRSAILACSQMGSLEMARWVEEFTASSEFKVDAFVNTTLIDMFAKCGSMESALRVFKCMPEKDTVAWSAIIVGYGLNSCGREAVDLFEEMKCAGVRPNDVTFLGVLLACSHAGLVEEGWDYFHAMREHGIEPRHQHYACMVDILARAGLVEDAYEFIMKMPLEPTVSVWGALLNACKVYGNVGLGACAAERIFTLDPSNAGHYVQLSNIYAAAGMWEDAAKVRVLMKKKGVTKSIGSSLIEINGKIQAFRASDKSHPKSKEIFAMLHELEIKLEEVGYTGFSFHGTESGVNVSICDHSERLAIAFGLISTAPGTTLRITKNLRACVKCHSATKLISKIIRREIIVRDVDCFHHFKDGCCSCGDCW